MPVLSFNLPGLDIGKLPIDLLINVADIVIMFLLIRFAIYKPVRKYLDTRKTKLEAQRTEAEKTLQDANGLKEQYQTMLQQSDEKVEEIISEGNQAARKSADVVLANAQKEAEAMLAHAKEEIESMKKDAQLDIQNEAVELAFGIVEKLTNQNMDDAANRRLAESMFAGKN